MGNDSRRFTDEEFALVLRKAMELHDPGSPSATHGDGLTLEEIKAVARDVGIDPTLVDRAVALLPAEETSLAQRLVGGPTKYRLEHSSDRRLEREDLSRLVDVIRREMDHHGKVTSELDGLTWGTEGEVSQFHVTLSPRETGTKVRVMVNRDGAFILTWFFSLLGGGIAAGITGAVIDPDTVAGGLAIAGTALSGGLAMARTLWGRSSRIMNERARRLMDALRAGMNGEPE